MATTRPPVTAPMAFGDCFLGRDSAGPGRAGLSTLPQPQHQAEPAAATGSRDPRHCGGREGLVPQILAPLAWRRLRGLVRDPSVSVLHDGDKVRRDDNELLAATSARSRRFRPVIDC